MSGIPSRRASIAGLAASYAFVMWMTLRPAPPGPVLPPFCIICGQLGGVDFVLNIALFVPVGLTLSWVVARRHHVILIGAGTTLIVELLQMNVIPGRDASLGDLVANTAGTALGVWAATAGPARLSATGAEARRLAAGVGLLVVVALMVAGWALRPAVPRYPLWVQWTPSRPNFDDFAGRLVEFRFNGAPRSSTDILAPDPATHSTNLQASVVVSGPARPSRSGRQSIIVQVANGFEEGLSLGQWRNAAIFRSYTNGARLRLRPLLIKLNGAFAGDSASVTDVVTRLSVRSDARRIVLSRERGNARIEATLPRTIGLAWTLVLYRDVAIDTSWMIANAFFLGGLIAPVAFFAARVTAPGVSDRSAAWMAWGPVALVLVTMAAEPLLIGLSPMTAGEWAGVAVGGAAGVITARLTGGTRPATI